jgi:hypothetical protein
MLLPVACCHEATHVHMDRTCKKSTYNKVLADEALKVAIAKLKSTLAN